MGYLSQVQAIVYGKNDALLEYIAVEKLRPDSIFRHLEGLLTHKVLDDMGVLELLAEDVKWYSYYHDVITWYRFMGESESYGLNFEFVRVGEDDEDIETENGGEDVGFYLNVQTISVLDLPPADMETKY